MDGYFNLALGGPIFDHIDSALHSTLAEGSGRVMGGLAMLYGSLWTLQFTAKTLVWYWHGLSVAIQEIVFSMLKMAVITACAFNIGWYISVAVPFFGDFPAWVGGKLMSSSGSPINAIDGLINAFLNAMVSIFENMTFSFSMDLIKGLVLVGLMLLGGVPFISVAIGTLVTLKVCTTLLLVVGPMFIAFLLFDSTKQWFWSWISTMGGFMLTQIFFSVVIALEMNFITSKIVTGGEVNLDWVGAFAILIVFNAFTQIAVSLPNIAASIMGGGAVPTTTMGGIMGKTLGAATGVGLAKKLAAYFAASRLLRNRIS